MTATTDLTRASNDLFAGFYDEFTGHHLDDAWAATLERLAQEAGLRGRRLLDIGCGTGKSFMPMLERGYEVTAIDLSAAMLDEAERKAAGRARLAQHDVRELPVLGTFDLAWAVGDAFNYLQSDDELRQAFDGVRRNLAEHAVLVFDLNTLGAFRAVHAGLLVHPAPDRVLLLDGQGAPDLDEGGHAEVWIDRLERADDGTWTRTRTIHRHRHHGEVSVRGALDRSGFECVAVLGADRSGAVEPDLDELRHTKSVYVARPKRA